MRRSRAEASAQCDRLERDRELLGRLGRIQRGSSGSLEEAEEISLPFEFCGPIAMTDGRVCVTEAVSQGRLLLVVRPLGTELQKSSDDKLQYVCSTNGAAKEVAQRLLDYNLVASLTSCVFPTRQPKVVFFCLQKGQWKSPPRLSSVLVRGVSSVSSLMVSIARTLPLLSQRELKPLPVNFGEVFVGRNMDNQLGPLGTPKAGCLHTP